jgi:protein-disulfide isomerase
MADTDLKPAGKKKLHPAVFVVIIALVLIVLGIAQYKALPTPAPQDAATAETPVTTQEGQTPSSEQAASAQSVTIDVNAALSDRILGDTTAPVKISEHASLTCGHCGAFHRETFDQVKKEYIDTGKAYLVFSDFPLNEAALHATMISRCLPQDKYFDFIHMLFAEQENWAYDPNYKEFLKTKAAENGVDEAHFNACLANKELQDGITNRMKGVQQQWNINSTPSFVINNRNTVSGALPYPEFKKLLDAEIEAKKADAPAAEATPSEEKAATPASEPVVEDTPAPAAETSPATESEGSGEIKAE